MQRRMMLAGYQPPAPPTYLTPTLRGVDSVAPSGTAATRNCSLATAGAQAGDVAVAWGLWALSGDTPTIAQSGWTAFFTVNLSTTFSGRAFWKVLDATDITNDTVSISCSAAARSAMGLAAWYNTTGLTNVQIASDGNNDTSQPIPALTTVSTQSRPAYVMALNMAASAAAVTQPAGHTELLEAITTNASGRRAAVECAHYTTGNVLSGSIFGTTSAATDVAAHSACWRFELVAAVV